MSNSSRTKNKSSFTINVNPREIPAKRLSSRRLKDTAKILREILSTTPPGTVPDQATCEDWAAKLLGFANPESVTDFKSTIQPSVQIPFGTDRLHPKSLIGQIFQKSKNEISVSSNSTLSHEVVLGSTGGGKTEVLLSRTFNLLKLMPDIGMLYFDGKGDASLAYRCDLIVRETSYKGSFYVLNFMSNSLLYDSSTSFYEMSHSFNPLQGFDSKQTMRWIDDTFMRLIHEGDRVIARSYFRAAATVHAALKGSGGLDSGIQGLSELFDPGKLSALYSGKRESLPFEAWEALDSLAELIGHSWHGTSVLGVSALVKGYLQGWVQAYPHVLGTRFAPDGTPLKSEVDAFTMFDGDFVQVLLPALEKSTEELSILAQSIISSFHIGMEALPKSHGLRTYAIFDEFGYYAPPSLDEMSAVASSRGVAMVIGSQDGSALAYKNPDLLPSLSRFGLKTFLKQEDPSSLNLGFIQSSFGASPPTIYDLRDQLPGEAWVSYPGYSGKMSMAYVNQKSPPNYRFQLERRYPSAEDEPLWSRDGR